MEEPAPRMFWPREIWGKHARSLAEFKAPANRPAASGRHLSNGARSCAKRLRSAAARRQARLLAGHAVRRATPRS